MFSRLNHVQIAAGVRFMGEGMASFRPIPVADERLSDVSFAFRSTQLAALLLNVDAQVSQPTAHMHTRAKDVIFYCRGIKKDIIIAFLTHNIVSWPSN